MIPMVPTRGSDSFARHLSAPIDGLWLALFRIGFGVCLSVQTWWSFSRDEIQVHYIQPKHHFTWFGLDWIRPWPGEGMYLHFLVLLTASICIAIGFRYRTACVTYCVGFTYVFLLDKSWYLNHHYLICLLSFLAIFLPANRQLSFDSWRYPELRRRTVPAWTLWLLRFQVGVPYFFGGIAKLNPDWLMGEPMRTWLAEKVQMQQLIFPSIWTEEWCVYFFVIGGLLLDLFLIPCLLWRRTRIAAMIAMTLFHLLNYYLLSIGIFPWLMLVATIVLFLPPETWSRLRGGDSESDDPVSAHKTHRAISAILICHVALQVLVPLRHHFYAGDTSLTRQGHHFSWRMKLNRRDVEKVFYAVDPDSGREYTLPLKTVLTRAQEPKVRDPDQILQVAGWLHDELPERAKHFEIRADVQISVNGREPVSFFDRELNLLSQQRSIWPANWVRRRLEPTWLDRSNEIKESKDDARPDTNDNGSAGDDRE